MEILEKLPGVTVERQMLLQGSYTSAANPSKYRNYGPTLGKSHSSKIHPESLRNSFAANRNRTQSQESQHRKTLMLMDNKPLKSHFKVSQYQSLFHDGAVDFELQVFGKNPQCLLRETTSKKEATPPITNEIESKQQSPVVLKSILKRSGSAVSSRSCSILEVMSLDSGMTRLAASLTAQRNEILRKSPQELSIKSPHLTSFEDKKKQKPLNLGRNSKEENHVQTRTVGPEAEQNPQKDMVVPSPSKTVSFKLDPEMQQREKERLLAQSKKGEAKWGVVISSFQARMPKAREKTSRRSDLVSVRKKENLRNIATFSTQERPDSKNQKNGVNSEETNQRAITPLRPPADRLKPSMADLHHLSEPYRKILMNRALEKTHRNSKENQSVSNTISLRSYLAAAANSIAQESSKPKGTGLDKSYMQMPHVIYSKKQTFLPTVKIDRK